MIGLAYLPQSLRSSALLAQNTPWNLWSDCYTSDPPRPPSKCLVASRRTSFSPSAYTVAFALYLYANRNPRSKNDLSKQLLELKNELLTLRVQKIAGGSASKLTKMCVCSVIR